MTGPVLVTGGTGQLATALTEAAPGHGLTVHRVGRPQFDFDRPASVAESFRASGSSLVINARSLHRGRCGRGQCAGGIPSQSRRAGETGPVVRGGGHSFDPDFHRLCVRWGCPERGMTTQEVRSVGSITDRGNGDAMGVAVDCDRG